jgi:MATE family multidrug resistance protein
LAIELSAMAVAGVLVGSIGAIQLAAHQIAINCSNAVLMVILGFAQGTFIRISYARGRREWKAVTEIAKSSLFITIVFGFVCGIAFVVLRNRLPMLFTQDKGVCLLSARLLLVAAVFQFSNAFQVMSAVKLRSIQDLKHPLFYSILSYWIIGLPAGYYLTFPAGMGIYGIWFSFIGGMTFSGAALHYRFRKLIHRSILT